MFLATDDDDVDDFPDFPRHAGNEPEVVEMYYFAQEFDYMPSPRLFEDPKLRKKRDEAISKIIQHTRGRNIDVFIPYLAISYYDRYASFNKPPSSRRNSAYAKCCLFLAFKMRDQDFNVLDFKKADKKLRISRKAVEELECKIRKGLDWRFWSITPFSFLRYYYPRYQHLPSFPWNSVINLIIQAQRDHILARQRHSDIASASLMAVAALAHPRQFLNRFVEHIDDTPWVFELIQLCGATANNIAIQLHADAISSSRRPNRDEASTSRSNNANDAPDEDALIRRRRGKGVIIASSSSQNNDRAIFSRRPGKDEASTSWSNANDDSAEDDEGPDEHSLITRRRRNNEVSPSTSLQFISRRPGRDEASTSRNNANDDSAEDDEPDEHALIPRRRRNEVASSSSHNDHHAIISRRPGKEEASNSKENANDSADDDEPDENALIPRRRRVNEVASSNSQNDQATTSRRPGSESITVASSEIEEEDDPLAVPDDQPFIRRLGKEPILASSENDDEHEVSRRPGKEPKVASSENDDEQEISRKPPADYDEEEDPRSLLEELGFTSESIDAYIEFLEQKPDTPRIILKRMGFSSDIIDPIFPPTSDESGSLEISAESPIHGLVSSSPQITTDDPVSVTDGPENPGGSASSSGSLAFPTSQANSSAVYDEPEISESPLHGLVPSSPQRTTDDPVSVTDEAENPSGSSSSSGNSQGNSSAVYDELDISGSPIHGLVSSSPQITTAHPLSVTDEPENPNGSSSSSGSLVFFANSQGNSSAAYEELEIPTRPENQRTSEEQEIFIRRPGKEVATTSGVSEEEERILRRPGRDVLTTPLGILRGQGNDEERRRLVAALDAALEAGFKAEIEKTDETQQNLLEASQRFTREVESATRSAQAESSRKFINTLQSLFDALQKPIRDCLFEDDAATEESDASVHTPGDVSKMSGFVASPSSGGNDSSDGFWDNIIVEPDNNGDGDGEEESRSSSLQTQPPMAFEIEAPPAHLLPPLPSPPRPHNPPANRRNIMINRIGGGNVADRLNTCCTIV